MSLRINTILRKIPGLIAIIIGLFLIGCIVKIAIWENLYYREKEGTPREALVELGVTTPSETQEVDETEITPQQVTEFKVAPDKPRYLSGSFMDKTIVRRARIREVGLTKDGALDTLPNIFDVAWYRDSAKPGSGGTLLLNAHNGGPTKTGVFKYLNEINLGDTITIERGDGQLFTYRTVDKQILDLTAANAYMSKMLTSPEPGTESISLISCTGEWSQAQRTYLSRVMVRAILEK